MRNVTILQAKFTHAGVIRKVGRAGGILTVLTSVLAGCTATGSMEDLAGINTGTTPETRQESTYASPLPKQKASIHKQEMKTVTVTTRSDGKKNGPGTVLGLRPDSYQDANQIRSHLSPHCRRILAETGIETTILRSPTMSGSYNTDKDISLGMSFELTDLSKADLKEQLALAQCARDLASIKLAQLLVTTSQSLTRAGFLAKANYLQNKRGRLNLIGRKITSGLNEGSMTIVHANVLRQFIEVVKSTEAQSKGEAAKRQIVDRIQQRDFTNLDNELIAAERRIQEIESRLRTVDGVNLKASVTYSRAGDASSDRSLDKNGSMTGKVEFSVKLGTFANRRYELEEISNESRIAGYYEVDRGSLWRAKEMAKVNQMVMLSLVQRRDDVLLALKEAKSNASLAVSEDQPELLMAKIRAEISEVALTSDLVGLQATIADTKRVDGKLNFRN